jgi:AcrR family transcriptional regulator
MEQQLHTPGASGERSNQKLRTRRALVEAVRDLVRQGERPTVAKAAKLALVSDATAYRYFPDQSALLREALLVPWTGADEALAKLPDDASPSDRVAAGAEALLRFVIANEAAVRSVMGLSLLRSVEGEAGRAEARAMRPGHRLALIDAALRPFQAAIDPERLRLVRLSLAAVIGAETLVALKDHCGSSDEEVIEVAVWTARAVVEAGIARAPTRRSERQSRKTQDAPE